MAKILIESYSAKTPENLISLMKENFDRICFLSFREMEAPTEENIKNLEKVICQITGIRPEFFSVENVSIEGVLSLLEPLLNGGNTLTVDLTGGNEIFAAAAGILFQKAAKNRVFLHQYQVKTGKKHFSHPVFTDAESFFPHYLSADQILTLNGSKVLVSPSYSFSQGCMRKEVLRLWKVVKENPKAWNHFCSLSAPGESEKNFLLQKDLGSGDSRLKTYSTVARKLKKNGIMTDENILIKNGRSIADFKLIVPEEALFLYEKAGNALEMYAALCAFDSNIFHDIRVGVKLDWNGTVEKSHIPDPKNEIDLILMHENLPILASCKNSPPQNEHLYEIMIMAKHYGGHYATPMVLATGNGSPTVRQRAKEMRIVLIDGIRHLSSEALSEKFCILFHQNI